MLSAHRLGKTLVDSRAESRRRRRKSTSRTPLGPWGAAGRSGRVRCGPQETVQLARAHGGSGGAGCRLLEPQARRGHTGVVVPLAEGPCGPQLGRRPHGFARLRLATAALSVRGSAGAESGRKATRASPGYVCVRWVDGVVLSASPAGPAPSADMYRHASGLP